MPHPEVPEPPDGERLSRRDMGLARQGAGQHWDMPPAVQVRLIQVLVDMADPDHEVGARTTPRDKARAVQTIAALQRLMIDQRRLEIEQAKLDLAREAARGKGAGATDPAGGLDPERAARALRALNEPPTPGDP